MPNILKNIWIVFLDEFIQSLKTKKALIIVVSYLFLMFIGIKVGSLFEIFAWAMGSQKQSFSILLPYYISVGLLPIFSIIISYNVLSEEISRGSIKFIAYRTNRFSIILGKVLSSFALSILMIFVAYVVALIYIYSKIGMWFFLQYSISWFYLTIYSFCFICLTTLISMISKSSSASITWSVLASVIFLIFLNFNYIKFISPFYFSNNALDYIVDGILLKMLTGFFVILLHIVTYFALSYVLLEKSDLF